MSVDIAALGYTLLLREPLTPLQLRVVLDEHRGELLENFDDIDMEEYVEYDNVDGVTDEDVNSLIGVLMEGYSYARFSLFAEYTVPGVDDRVFVMSGGWTPNGQSPFKGYEELEMIVRAATYIPALGDKIGLLGSGIIIREIAPA